MYCKNSKNNIYILLLSQLCIILGILTNNVCWNENSMAHFSYLPLEKCFGDFSAETTWHLYPSSPGGAVHEWEKMGDIGYTANWLCSALTSLGHLCFPFRSVEDIHWRRSSNQPDVFKSRVQNRAWRLGQGFVPGKVWKGPLLRWDRQYWIG